MASLGIFALGVLAALLAAATLVKSRYSLRPKSLKTPVGEFDITRFADLSQVQLFQNVSVMVITPSSDALDWAKTSQAKVAPVAFIHAGWTLVCDTFVQQFGTFPTDDAVRQAIQKLGSQNVDFIISYRKIYESSVSYSADVPPDFAVEYFVRAPALSQRIAGGAEIASSSLFEALSATAREQRLSRLRDLIPAPPAVSQGHP
ncbi:MAG: hypothetical protein QOG72_1780 [Sphingomonadales bacterium]|jgi:hypothetical protein|nr:hypothetical protein [Sphingomonadales bacterium]